MPSSIRVELNVPFEMRDGTLLRADVYRPDGSDRYPAILIRTPYNKEWFSQSLFHPISYARIGYAVVIQDIRGRYASEGIWDRTNMFAIEGADGYDTVEQIAIAPWCNGNVALGGGSYLTALQWLTAMESPPHLKAFAPYIGDIGTNIAPPSETGAVSFYSAANAIPLTVMEMVEKMEARGENVQELRRDLERAKREPAWMLQHLPFKDHPLTRYEPIRRMLHQRLTPPAVEEQKKRRRYENVTVPGLHIGGWFDQLEYAVFANYRKMRECGGSRLAKDNQYVLIGPWDHGNPRSFLGDLEFGSAAGSEPEIRRYVLDFYDKFLLGKEVDIPAVRYFLMGKNEWRCGDEWPLSHSYRERWFFHSGGRANTAAGDGSLSREEPGQEEADRYLYNPLDPVPTVGGRLLAMGGMVPGPKDQSRVEQRQDVLCYTSAELEEDMEVTGPVAIRLFASTSAADTDFTAKLVDVRSNGQSILVAEGIQRARYRQWGHSPKPVTPGEIVEYTITLGNTSYLFRRGHRLRVHLSSSNFPLYDRNMNTGCSVMKAGSSIQAFQTIYHQQEYPSCLEMYVVPQSKETRDFSTVDKTRKRG